ncbi:hypothetical protein F4802DRAFT_596523 [Xylaria palmicola]|nr:hypothetical protein F4802DRAFT_596523 [Xylaria palmicola]
MPMDRAWIRQLLSLTLDDAIEYDKDFESYQIIDSQVDVKFTDGSVSAGETGRVTLIGDAAHAMSPMGGSGADTAIRNAADLARTIAECVTRDNLAGFESRMEARAKEKIEHSFKGGQKFWRGKEWTEYSEIDV